MKIIILGILVLLLVGTLLLTSTLNKKAKGQYDFYIEDLDKKEWSLKDFIPVGLYIESLELKEKLPGSMREWLQNYDIGIYNKILILYGKKNGSEKMYHVYQGNKNALGLLTIVLIAIFAPAIAYTQEDLALGCMLWAAAIVLVPGIMFLLDLELNKKIKAREQELLLEFPVFASKFLLLVDAGITVNKAIRKVVVENKKKNKLYDELNDMLRNIDAGMAETAAYEEFSRRCKVKEITRFVSVLVQSLNRGSADLSATLKLQTQECWEARKNMAKQLGAEASTKLVVPLMLMMLGIIFIVAAPAMMTFRGM